MSLPPLPGIRSKSADQNLTKTQTYEDNENPFKLPNDDQIFRMREQERKRKDEMKQKIITLPIWKRQDFSETSTVKRLHDIMGDTHVISLKEAIVAHDGTQKVNLPRRQEKENISEFVSKKREMFLVQMSLDTKREEIRKLEEKAKMKEDSLARAEQLLEEDSMRFDAFLKENDQKAHAAIKKAEEETKRKQEKVQEIKRLTQHIQQLNSEMTKHSDALAECLRYKAFLDMLTPMEWFEHHKRQREQKIMELKQQQFEQHYKEWDRMRRKMIEQHRKEMEQRKEARKERTKKLGSGRVNQQQEDEEEDEPETKVQIPPAPKLEDEIVDIPEEEISMYFKDPQQLMDIYSLLEEQNLFLIQNSQIAERTLESLEHDLKETEMQMNAQGQILQHQIDELKQQIEEEDHRIKLLMVKRASANDTDGDLNKKDAKNNEPKLKDKNIPSGALTNQSEKEKVLRVLNQAVIEVYVKCGFDASSKPDTLSMLSQLESRLELLLQDIERLPPDYVMKAEREKEKKRREEKRKEQQKLQQEQQELRNQRAIERSMQAPKKRIGRQVMYRSRPKRAEEKKQEENTDGDNTDEIKYLS
jgi:hypothetical protein